MACPSERPFPMPGIRPPATIETACSPGGRFHSPPGQATPKSPANNDSRLTPVCRDMAEEHAWALLREEVLRDLAFHPLNEVIARAAHIVMIPVARRLLEDVGLQPDSV